MECEIWNKETCRRLSGRGHSSNRTTSRSRRETISLELLQALEWERVGPQGPQPSPERRRRVAVQEGATALVATLLPAIEPVRLHIGFCCWLLLCHTGRAWWRWARCGRAGDLPGGSWRHNLPLPHVRHRCVTQSADAAGRISALQKLLLGHMTLQ